MAQPRNGSAVPHESPAAMRMDGAAAGALLEANPDGMVLCDESGAIVFVNSQLEQLSGFDRRELVGQPVEMLIRLGLTSVHQGHRLRFQAAPTVRSMGEGRELALRRSDGTEVSVEISLAPVTVGGTTFTAAGIRDVTTRRAADRSRRRLLATLDLVPDSVFICRSESEPFDYVNVGARLLLDYTQDELKALTLGQVMSSGPGQSSLLAMTSTGGTPVTIEATLRTHSGASVPVEVRVIVIPESDDDDAAFLLVAQDLRERLASARRLQESEEAFRAAFEQAPVGIVVTGQNARRGQKVIRANQAFADFLFQPIDEVIGRDPATFSHPEDDWLDQVATDAKLSGLSATSTVERRYRRADGTYVWGELHSSLLRESLPDGQHSAQAPKLSPGMQRVWLSHVIDISARKAEAVRSERSARLKQNVGDLSVALFAGRHEDAVLTAAVIGIADIFGATGAAAYRQHNQRDGLQLASRVGTTPEPADLERSGSGYAWGSSPWEFVAPFGADADRSGWLWLGRSATDTPFTATDTELLTSYASQLTTLLELNDNRATRQRIELLEERERIGRDLHDTVIQDLFAVGMQIDAALPRLREEDLQVRFESVVNQIDDAIRRLRGAVFDLHRKSSNASPSLRDELTITLREAARVLGHKPSLEVDGPVDNLSPAIVEQLVPTLREALSNVARHARATETKVSVSLREGFLRLRVLDNGVGLSADAIPGSGSVNIKERAAGLGGTASIERFDGGGSRVEWVVPVASS